MELQNVYEGYLFGIHPSYFPVMGLSVYIMLSAKLPKQLNYQQSNWLTN